MRNGVLHFIRPPRPLRIEFIFNIPSLRTLIIRQPHQSIRRYVPRLNSTVNNVKIMGALWFEEGNDKENGGVYNRQDDLVETVVSRFCKEGLEGYEKTDFD